MNRWDDSITRKSRRWISIVIDVAEQVNVVIKQKIINAEQTKKFN